MKTLLIALTTLALLDLGTRAIAADKTTQSVAFTNRSQPGKIEVNLSSGNLTIRGTDASEITVTSTVKSNSVPRADGLRVLGASSGFSLTENSNVARLEYLGNSGPGTGKDATSADFEVAVPRGTAVIVGGRPDSVDKIEVNGVSGDVEIRSMSGDVTLSGLRGAALVETMSGNITASFAEFSGKPVSFTSMRGKIEVRVPANTKAGIRLRSYTGEILTDFDDKALVSRTEQTGSEKTAVAIYQVARGGVTNVAKQLEVNALERRLRDEDIAAQARAADGARALQEARGAEARAAGAARAMQVVRPVPGEARDLLVQRNNTFSIPPMTGGKLVTGTLNGGGAEISLATMNGDVTLRKFSP